MTSDKKLKLEQIKADILKNNICPDLAKQAKQLVFGDGNPSAEIVFIGEAPGKKEDEQGIPFVGSAGKFLNEMLESINLKREDVYITNIVKYRPPDNRDPLPEEKQVFMPYLAKQLEVIEPKLTIFLGRHSMNSFFPDLIISKVHGRQIKDGKGRSYLALYHPAAALYNGGLRQTLLDDFSKIPTMISKIN
jgi:uracil-DNA glycosylase family 4